MKYIFNSAYISNHKVLFYAYLVVIIAIIIFAIYMTYKEIKNEHK